jgi:hypothetical protein
VAVVGAETGENATATTKQKYDIRLIRPELSKPQWLTLQTADHD